MRVLRTWLKPAAVLLLAVGLLAVFLRNADFSKVGAEIVHGRPDLIAAAFVTVASTYFFRALRWKYLLAPIGEAHFSAAFRTTVIGFAASSVLPARVGEVLRPYLLARREHLSFTATFATIFLERLLDLIGVLILLAIAVLVLDQRTGNVDPAMYRGVKVGGLATAALAFGTLVAMLILSGRPELLDALLALLRGRLPEAALSKVALIARTFLEGFAVVRQPVRLFVAILLTLPLWLSIAMGIWLVPLAFGIAVPYAGSFLLTALLVVGVAVPTPGAVGGFHEAFRIGVTVFFGAPNDKAVGAAIVLHAISFIPVTLVGLLFMMQEGLDLGAARGVAEAARHEHM